jgi:hypothetical protein
MYILKLVIRMYRDGEEEFDATCRDFIRELTHTSISPRKLAEIKVWLDTAHWAFYPFFRKMDNYIILWQMYVERLAILVKYNPA